MGAIKSQYGKSTIIDDLYQVISMSAEIPGFDHIRLFGTCKLSPSGMTLIAGEWRPENESGQQLMFPHPVNRFFKYTDSESEWFFDWVSDQMINPATNLSVQLLPKCVIVMDPSVDCPFRAEVSLSSFGIDELSALFSMGTGFLNQGSLGRQFVAYVRPAFLPEKFHPSFNLQSTKPSFGGKVPTIPPDYVDHGPMPRSDGNPLLENNPLFGDILATVDKHVNSSTVLTGFQLSSPDSILTDDAQRIVEDTSLNDMIASRANMDRTGAELQKQIQQLAGELLPPLVSLPDEETQSVAPSDVSSDIPTSAEILATEELAAQTVEDMAAVDSMFPEGAPPETEKP